MYWRKYGVVIFLLVVTLAAAGCRLQVAAPTPVTEVVATAASPTATETAGEENASTTPAVTGTSPQITATAESTPVAGDPEVSVSPRSVTVGREAELTASGFPARTDVVIGIGRVNSEYDVLKEVQTDTDGSLETSLTIPEVVTPEEAWVVVVDAVDHPAKAVSDALQVQSGTSQASIVVQTNSASVGESVQVEGEGFPANVTVELGIGRVNSEYDLLESTESDAEGAFQAQFTIPEFVDPEDAWVIVAAADENRVKAISAEIEITR